MLNQFPMAFYPLFPLYQTVCSMPPSIHSSEKGGRFTTFCETTNWQEKSLKLIFFGFRKGCMGPDHILIT